MYVYIYVYTYIGHIYCVCKYVDVLRCACIVYVCVWMRMYVNVWMYCDVNTHACVYICLDANVCGGFDSQAP